MRWLGAKKKIKGKWYEFAPNTASVRRKALTSFWITFSSAAGTTSADVVAAAGAAGAAADALAVENREHFEGHHMHMHEHLYSHNNPRNVHAFNNAQACGERGCVCGGMSGCRAGNSTATTSG